ncbi:MAG: hypothetical protein HY508_01605 [Acidobacteria bacterium]|nr:hypothetical protein [Acidobacteriota bacterium]
MDSIKSDSEPAETAKPIPTEPFPCPECGQMLSASCRVCVACKVPVDYARVNLQEKVTLSELPDRLPAQAVVPARFSWGIFFVVFLIYFLMASLSQATLGFRGSTYTMGGFVLASSLWVFRDARAKGIPKPGGWALACVLLWMVFFPWYLSRRRTPYRPCPVIEAESGPIARAIILFLILLTIFGAVMMVLSGDFPLK